MCGKLSQHEIRVTSPPASMAREELTDDRRAPPRTQEQARATTSATKVATVPGVGNSESGAQESLAGLLHLPAVQEVTSLFRQFIAAAGNGLGAPGIARVLQQHTGMAVIVQNRAGASSRRVAWKSGAASPTRLGSSVRSLTTPHTRSRVSTSTDG